MPTLKCPYASDFCEHPVRGYTILRCQIITKATGIDTIFVSETNCLKCSQKDEPGNFVHETINTALRTHIRSMHEIPYFGKDNATIEDLFTAYASRVGDEDAAKLLIAAKENGMPDEQAISLARVLK
jgi:hypothetical protein